MGGTWASLDFHHGVSPKWRLPYGSLIFVVCCLGSAIFLDLLLPVDSSVEVVSVKQKRSLLRSFALARPGYTTNSRGGYQGPPLAYTGLLSRRPSRQRRESDGTVLSANLLRPTKGRTRDVQGSYERSPLQYSLVADQSRHMLEEQQPVLPPLSRSEREAFEGEPQVRTYRARTLFYQVRRSGQEEVSGRWFTPDLPSDRHSAEILLNIAKWGNDGGHLRAVLFLRPVTGYYGNVAGGTGRQFFVPEGVDLQSIMAEVRLWY